MGSAGTQSGFHSGHINCNIHKNATGLLNSYRYIGTQSGFQAPKISKRLEASSQINGFRWNPKWVPLGTHQLQYPQNATGLLNSYHHIGTQSGLQAPTTSKWLKASSKNIGFRWKPKWAPLGTQQAIPTEMQQALNVQCCPTLDEPENITKSLYGDQLLCFLCNLD